MLILRLYVSNDEFPPGKQVPSENDVARRCASSSTCTLGFVPGVLPPRYPQNRHARRTETLKNKTPHVPDKHCLLYGVP